MTSSAVSVLSVTQFGPMIQMYERALKDKSYSQSPIGLEVRRYLRAYRYAGAPKTTLDNYELVLARLALDHDHFDSLEVFASPVGREYVEEFLHRHWGDSSEATRANRLAIVRSFFKWAHEEQRCSANPSLGIKGPRVRTRERQTYSAELIAKLVNAQPTLRDQCAVSLLGRLGLRKNELRILRVGEIDLARGFVAVHGKGGKDALVPVGFESLRALLSLHINGEERQPDEYLIYPRRDRGRPMDPATVHRWFERCQERAGMSGMEMHELRHSAADALWRETGNLILAQKLLRHESVGTTQIYIHATLDDLAAGLRQVERSWEASDD